MLIVKAIARKAVPIVLAGLFANSFWWYGWGGLTECSTDLIPLLMPSAILCFAMIWDWSGGSGGIQRLPTWSNAFAYYMLFLFGGVFGRFGGIALLEEESGQRSWGFDQYLAA